MAIKGKGKGKGKQYEEEVDDHEEEEEEEEEEEGEEGDDDADGYGEVSPELLPRIVHLKNLQEKVDEVDKEYILERIALEEKFRLKREVFHNERSQIISGETEAPPLPPKEGEDAPAPVDESEKVKGIPDFWLHALGNHPDINGLITEGDIDALKHLHDIKVTYNETYTGFTVHFYFTENDFFTNSVLEKSYVLEPNIFADRPRLVDSTHTEINWKKGKNLCEEEVQKKQKAKSGKNKGQTRTITRVEPKHSFFHYFSQPEDRDEEEDEEDEEQEQPIKLNEDEDYEVGYALRVDIVPNAISWFTGEAVEDYEFGDDDEEGDEEEESDEDDDEGDASGKQKRKEGKGANAFSGVGADGANPQECKQS